MNFIPWSIGEAELEELEANKGTDPTRITWRYGGALTMELEAAREKEPVLDSPIAEPPAR